MEIGSENDDLLCLPLALVLKVHASHGVPSLSSIRAIPELNWWGRREADGTCHLFSDALGGQLSGANFQWGLFSSIINSDGTVKLTEETA